MTLNLNHPFINRLLLTLLGLSISTLTTAVQPMSESDLEIVSATTGANILNIFGASQAGLKVDDSDNPGLAISKTELTSEKYSEGEATAPIALSKLQSLEKESIQTTNSSPNQTPALSAEAQNTIVKLNEFTKGEASLYSTSSEINYKASNVHHEMRNLENGGVGVSRDIQVDLLKLENLRGAHADESRSAGSIYISDWNSQGDTRIISNN